MNKLKNGIVSIKWNGLIVTPYEGLILNRWTLEQALSQGMAVVSNDKWNDLIQQLEQNDIIGDIKDEE